jgi:hypothetical protein
MVTAVVAAVVPDTAILAAVLAAVVAGLALRAAHVLAGLVGPAAEVAGLDVATVVARLDDRRPDRVVRGRRG